MSQVHRIVCAVIGLALWLSIGLPFWLSAALGFALLNFAPDFFEKRQPAVGGVFVTGADSGMGEQVVWLLAGKGYHVVAGCYMKEQSEKSLRKKIKGTYGKDDMLTCVQLDVTKQASIDAAVEATKEALKGVEPGLVAVVNCAGISYTAPCEYMPLDQYRHQVDVNMFGYIAVTQAFLKLIKSAVNGKEDVRRGRCVFVGTGGGVPCAIPALLSAYMSSKWGIEAFSQSLRLEMQLTRQRIDASMINPGFVKPTGLMAGGLALLDKTWAAMPKVAKETYGPLVDKFIKFSEEQPGTHPIEVAKAVEEALAAEAPLLRYKVGIDSKISPFMGVLPTVFREWAIKKSIYNFEE